MGRSRMTTEEETGGMQLPAQELNHQKLEGARKDSVQSLRGSAALLTPWF